MRRCEDSIALFFCRFRRDQYNEAQRHVLTLYKESGQQFRLLQMVAAQLPPPAPAKKASRKKKGKKRKAAAKDEM